MYIYVYRRWDMETMYRCFIEWDARSSYKCVIFTHQNKYSWNFLLMLLSLLWNLMKPCFPPIKADTSYLIQSSKKTHWPFRVIMKMCSDSFIYTSSVTGHNKMAVCLPNIKIESALRTFIQTAVDSRSDFQWTCHCGNRVAFFTFIYFWNSIINPLMV